MRFIKNPNIVRGVQVPNAQASFRIRRTIDGIVGSNIFSSKTSPFLCASSKEML
jgi:hypothetical protein